MFQLFVENFSNYPILAVLLVSMTPTLESKIAIPLALASNIWGKQTLSPILAVTISCLGSLIPAIVIIPTIRLIKKKACGLVLDKFISKIESKYKNNVNKLKNKNDVFKKCVQLATFVAIPLPLTGVYSASIIAGLIDIKFVYAFLAISIGEVMSASIILLLCLFFENSTFYILIASLILVFVYIGINVLANLLKNSKKKEKRWMICSARTKLSLFVFKLSFVLTYLYVVLEIGFYALFSKFVEQNFFDVVIDWENNE